jgi:hypothetical protein
MPSFVQEHASICGQRCLPSVWDGNCGSLTSNIWKRSHGYEKYRYSFNLFRTKRNGKVTNLFRPDDVLPLANFVRVISQVLVDDGCISPEQRRVFLVLAAAMDEFLDSPAVREVDAESI